MYLKIIDISIQLVSTTKISFKIQFSRQIPKSEHAHTHSFIHSSMHTLIRKKTLGNQCICIDLFKRIDICQMRHSFYQNMHSVYQMTHFSSKELRLLPCSGNIWCAFNKYKRGFFLSAYASTQIAPMIEYRMCVNECVHRKWQTVNYLYISQRTIIRNMWRLFVTRRSYSNTISTEYIKIHTLIFQNK